MELRHLRYIVAAADHPSLHQAAISLNVQKSTISRSIRTVEAWLGVPLFERTNNGTSVTHAGTPFVDGARLIVDLADRIVTDAKAVGCGAAGRLQIGIHTSMAAGHLRATLASLHEKAPDISVQITEASRRRLLAHARAGVLDVAIIGGEQANANLESVSAWSDRIVAILPADHPLASRESIYWTDLASETLLFSTRDPGPQLEALLLGKLPSASIERRISRHAVAHSTMPQLVGAQQGVTLVCAGSVEFGPHAVAVDVRDAAGVSGLQYIAHFRRDHRNPALGVFLKVLRERYPSRA